MKISAISRMTRHLPVFAVLLVSPLVGVGCTPAPPAETSAGEAIAPGINQGILCTVDNLFPVGCERGQKILFMPPRFGNEQLPVIFAAGNCDMRYSIALTNGAVACIYAPLGEDDEVVGNDGTDDEKDEISKTADDPVSEP